MLKHGTPFRAAAMFAAALSAAITKYDGDVRAARESIDPYEGGGKNRTKHHDNGGSRMAQRAVRKARNKARHRAHCKG